LSLGAFGIKGVANDVNALVGSARFKLNEAFSAQIAHWSCGSNQYLPRFLGIPPCSGMYFEPGLVIPNVEATPVERKDTNEVKDRRDASRFRR